jgi:hypothetical protein
LRELLYDPLEQFEKLPCNADELDAIHILVDDEFAKFIYDPIIHQKQHHDAPAWCVAFVDLLKYTFQFKEWVCTMHRQTDADFEHETTLSFFIHTNTVLEILGLVKKNSNKTEETEDHTEQSSDNSFSHHSDRK